MSALRSLFSLSLYFVFMYVQYVDLKTQTYHQCINRFIFNTGALEQRTMELLYRNGSKHTQYIILKNKNNIQIMVRIKISHATQDNIRCGISLVTALELVVVVDEQLFSTTTTTTQEGEENSNDDEEEEELLLIVDQLMISNLERAQQMIQVIEKSTPSSSTINKKKKWKRIRFQYSGGKYYGLVIQAAVQHSETLEMTHRSYGNIQWNFPLLDFANNAENLHTLQLTGCNFHDHEFINSISYYLGGSSSVGVGTNNSPPRCTIRNLTMHACKFCHPETFPIFCKCLQQNTSLERLWMARCELSDTDIHTLIYALIRPCGSNNISELGLSYNNCGPQGSKAIVDFILSNPRLQVLYLNKQQGEMDLKAIITAFNKNRSIQKLNLARNYVDDTAAMTEILRSLIIDPSRRDHVILDGLTSQLKWVEMPLLAKRNDTETEQTQNTTNASPRRRRTMRVPQSIVSKLSQQELEKLHDACDNIKNIFRNEEEDKEEVSSFTTTSSSIRCCLPYLRTIMELGENKHEWLAKFLRKSIIKKKGGDIQRLRHLLENAPRNESESKLLEQVWKDIVELDKISKREKKPQQPKNKKNKIKKFVPLTAENSPLVTAAYECIDDDNWDDVVPNDWFENREDCSFLCLLNPPIFINSVGLLQNLQQQLLENCCKLVGVDSEWSSKSISTLQISFLADKKKKNDDGNEGGGIAVIRSFIIDLMVITSEFQIAVKDFILWLFRKDSNCYILGFAFGSDLHKLRDFVVGVVEATTTTTTTVGEDDDYRLLLSDSNILDMQQLLAVPSDYGSLPGSKRCAQRYFQKPLSKKEQCSDWARRPLSEDQLYYAGLDSAILLGLLYKKKQEERLNSESQKF